MTKRIFLDECPFQKFIKKTKHGERIPIDYHLLDIRASLSIFFLRINQVKINIK